jgi:tetratricopeptide (TPR) repeat protein
VTSYSRSDVLRILQISSRQLQGWERAGLIAHKRSYTIQDLGQLRTLRALREESVPASAIRNSIVAMKAVAGMANPLVEACLVRTGTRIAFRHRGAVVDPIRRQLLFDFDRLDHLDGHALPSPIRYPGFSGPQTLQESFLAAVQAEETNEQDRAVELYKQILERDPGYAPAHINLGTIHFHMRRFELAEQYYRSATIADPGYVLAFFDLGNALDELQRFEESIEAYQQAIRLAPGYADAHYNLALAFERKDECRPALLHWQAYLRYDCCGPWADHARSRIRILLSRDQLSITWRSKKFVFPGRDRAELKFV